MLHRSNAYICGISAEIKRKWCTAQKLRADRKEGRVLF